MRTTSRAYGFTLIELSIVLVIIGLLAGGLFVGRDLIRAAQLRATIRQVESLDAAIQTFVLKYDCLPGDCTDPAGQGFAVPPGTSFTLANITGDGNDRIAEGGTGYEPVTSLWFLRSSGLLKGVRVDTATNAITLAAPIHSVSRSGHEASWRPGYMTNLGVTEDGWSTVLESGHYYWLADHQQGSGGSITPAEAFGIDAKIDDGRPISGRVLGYQRTYNFAEGTMPFFIPDGGTGAAGGPDEETCIADDQPVQYYNVESAVHFCHIAVRAAF